MRKGYTGERQETAVLGHARPHNYGTWIVQGENKFTSDLLELNFFTVFLLHVNLSHFILILFSNPNS